MLYVTPDRFRHMGFGVDLTDIADFELRSICERASNMVDTFCAVPGLPSRYSFRGGSIVDEQHAWKPNAKVWPNYFPISEITALSIDITRDARVDIDPNHIYINKALNYFEIVAMTVSPIGFFAQASLISVQPPIVRVSYDYGWDFAVTGEVLEATDAFEYRGQNQFWSDDPAPVVYRNGTIVTADYTINSEEGSVIFDEAQVADDVIRVDYHHPLPSDVAMATGLVVSFLMNERQLTGAGMGNLAEIEIAEVHLRRDSRRTGTALANDVIPDQAKLLLNGYTKISVR